jgi:hypothetical protein
LWQATGLLPPQGKPPERVQVFAITGSTSLEKGQKIPNMDAAYNKTVAEFYRLYSINSGSNPPSASNPNAWANIGAQSNLTLVKEEIETFTKNGNLTEYVGLVSMGASPPGQLRRCLPVKAPSQCADGAICGCPGDEIWVGRPLLAPGRVAGNAVMDGATTNTGEGAMTQHTADVQFFEDWLPAKLGVSVHAARLAVCNDSLALNQSCHWNTTAELNATNAPLFWYSWRFQYEWGAVWYRNITTFVGEMLPKAKNKIGANFSPLPDFVSNIHQVCAARASDKRVFFYSRMPPAIRLHVRPWQPPVVCVERWPAPCVLPDGHPPVCFRDRRLAPPVLSGGRPPVQWVESLRLGAFTMGWAEDYIWQQPMGTPQMGLLRVDQIRAGLRKIPDADRNSETPGSLSLLLVAQPDSLFGAVLLAART